MNWDQVEGNWKQLKGKAQEKWGRLTNDELDVVAGSREQLVGRLQEHYGLAREEAEKEADRWASGVMDAPKKQ
ncbi:CsbD family protein [Pelagibius sp. 7325]|uniref:CsbD family protein n=1 Tax=Pelagibius sp. 7325 TaxID=3131994 RepID=UPI0030EE23EA